MTTVALDKLIEELKRGVFSVKPQDALEGIQEIKATLSDQDTRLKRLEAAAGGAAKTTAELAAEAGKR